MLHDLLQGVIMIVMVVVDHRVRVGVQFYSSMNDALHLIPSLTAYIVSWRLNCKLAHVIL